MTEDSWRQDKSYALLWFMTLLSACVIKWLLQ